MTNWRNIFLSKAEREVRNPLPEFSCLPPLFICYKKGEGLDYGRMSCKPGQVRKKAAVVRFMRVMFPAPHFCSSQCSEMVIAFLRSGWHRLI